MFKRISLFVLASLLVVSMVGCSGGKENTQTSTTNTSDTQQISEKEIINNKVDEYFNSLSAESTHWITAKDLNNIIKNDPSQIHVVDMRKKSDYEKGHIPGSKHIWWFDIGDQLDTLPKDKTIVFYCFSGQSSAQVVGTLRMAGYDAMSVLGGWNNGWLKEDLTVEK